MCQESGGGVGRDDVDDDTKKGTKVQRKEYASVVVVKEQINPKNEQVKAKIVMLVVQSNVCVKANKPKG